ncbi:MAG: hypothetical protein HQM09_05885 [Candidatus Riflebacteria bacterium]|nr:hypothetical protein [Candidatus Riflebacteria bacterium]
MICYYAVGGGLGHLTRAAAVIHTLGIDKPVTLITGSPFASDPRVIDPGNRVISVASERLRDRALLRARLADIFDLVQPSMLIIDAFPAGILGEIDDSLIPEKCKCLHLARLLRWPVYNNRIRAAMPRFDMTYLLEPLYAEHTAGLRQVSRHMEQLDLEDPPVSFIQSQKYATKGSCASDAAHSWLIVHAGSDEELIELVSYARETASLEGSHPAMAAVFPGPRPAALPSDIAHIDIFPAYPMFESAERIFSACGFNIMRQTRSLRERHRFMPFARTLDDQFRRAAIARCDTGQTH